MTFTIVWEHIVISLPLWIAPALRLRSCTDVYAGGLARFCRHKKKPLFKSIQATTAYLRKWDVANNKNSRRDAPHDRERGDNDAKDLGRRTLTKRPLIHRGFVSLLNTLYVTTTV